MVKPIEDYAILGDLQTVALVARDGSIDWLCLPRFDSGACFASLVGTPENGFWKVAPVAEAPATRGYRGDTLILETTFETATGEVRLIDFMPPRGAEPDVVRIVEGVSGRVSMRCELTAKFDYGSAEPWVRTVDGGVDMLAGPDGLTLHTPVALEHEGCNVHADFEVAAGERVSFVLGWHRSYEDPTKPLDPEAALNETEHFWTEWSSRSAYEGPHRDLVMRSLLTLKALTYAPTGGIVAAATTSLPEELGGVRNWDYRYCWLRDATFTLYALYQGGYVDEAIAWRDWLLRAVAGRPDAMHIMYGVEGERRLPELELPWLEGYAGSKPVRIGNLAATQFQLDVYGEVMDAMHTARRAGVAHNEDLWALQVQLIETLADVWQEPDEGIWEIRGPRRHFTHSKVMAWVAVDRAVKAVERFGHEGPLEKWKELRDAIHSDVCTNGVDADRGVFVQSYGSKELDASLLMIPLVGFLPAEDPLVVATVEAIQDELTEDGFVRRYRRPEEVDGLPGDEGTFLACSFWLADCLALIGRRDEAEKLFEQLCSVANDVGLLAEQYDPRAGRMLGNVPQALSHVSLVNTAQNLSPGVSGPAEDRRHD